MFLWSFSFLFDLCKYLSGSTENKEILSSGMKKEKLLSIFSDIGKLFNNKRINIFFIAWRMSLCSIDFLFNNNTLFYNNEKNKNIYDNDNNIKPIEVNFNNNEYIIFSRFCLLFVRRSWWRLSYIFLVIIKYIFSLFCCGKCEKGNSLERRRLGKR